MSNGFDDALLNLMDATPELEDYTGMTGFYTAGNAIRRKKPILRQGRIFWGVTATLPNVTAAGRNVRNGKKRKQRKSTMMRWSV